MDQTSQAAAIAIQIGAAGGVIGMLTIFGLASRTSRVTRPVQAREAVGIVAVRAETAEADTQHVLGAGDVLVAQRGASTSV